MKHYKGSIILFCLLTLTFSSCEKELNTEVIVNPKLCFNCILNPDSIIHGSLTLSQSISENKPLKKINDAIIEINKDGQIVDTMHNTGNGIYHLNIKPSSGSLYKIRIILKEFPVLTASTTIPGKPVVTFQKGDPELQIINEYYSYSTYRTTYTIHDKPETNRYWQYKLILTNGIWRFGGGYYDIDSPIFDDFNKVTDATDKYGFHYEYYLRVKDTGFDGQLLTYSQTSFLTDQEIIYFLDTDEHYDKYLKSTIKQRMNDGDNLLFNEPIQIYSNIENGLGIFGSVAITSFKL